MIRAKNLTPFAFGYGPCLRRPGQPEMTLAVRARFVLEPGRALVPVTGDLTGLNLDDDFVPADVKQQLEDLGAMMAQGPIQSDLYEEDDAHLTGALLYPTDLAEFKLNAEVLFKGSCHPPRGSAVEECEVALEVGEWSKRLVVTGHRQWIDRIVGGKATKPIPFESMPIDWEHAYGGPDFEFNPVGCGHPLDKPLEQRQDELLDLPLSIQRAFTMHERLPNIEAPGARVHQSTTQPMPAGLGPLSSMWPQRRAKLGKDYGPTYRETREPCRPADFDWTHHHAAPADQQLHGYLRGDESIRLVNLHPGASDLRATLPGLRMRVFVVDHEDRAHEVSMFIDTLFIDGDAKEVSLVWRGVHGVGQDDLSDVAAILVAAERAGDDPKPADEYLSELREFVADPAGLNDTMVPALKRLDDDLESGDLERDLDAIPEDDQMLANMIERVGGPLLEEEQLKTMRETAVQTVVDARQNNPDSIKALKEQFKKSLRECKDPPIAPTLTRDADGKPTIVGPLRQALQGVGAAQAQEKFADVDFTDSNDLIEEAISRIDDAGVIANRDKLKMDAITEGRAVEPGPRRDLSYQDFSDRDLRGVDLTEANLEGAVFNRGNLSGVCLDGANLTGASLSSADLSDASCKNANFDTVFFSRTKLHGANLSSASLNRAIVMNCDFSSATLDGVTAYQIQFQKCSLKDARLVAGVFEFAAFNECDLRGAKFDRAKLVHSLMRECQMQGASLHEAELDKAGIISCDLTGACIQAANCEATSWFKSDLTNADFSFAKMPDNLLVWAPAAGANFYAADMPKVRLYKAALRGARFEKANLFEADMRKTVLTECDFRKANMYEAQLTEGVGTDVDFRGANQTKMVVLRAKMTRKG